MTIINKLKLHKYTNMAVINQPSDYDVFAEQATTWNKDHDAVFIFVETVDEMVAYTHQVIRHRFLLENGYLFFAYPKKGNPRYKTFIHRDDIFPAMNVGEGGYVADSDLKFLRMVSMDDVFTVVGLKREQKKAKNSLSASQRVADYEDRVKELEAQIADHPEVLSFYQRLTPGYQKDWARYIFSAKQQKTREKRHQQMIDILAQGYKSIDLYRQKKK
ncbi:Bacteriocin-protection, YdeI or OmpD-Associated [Evansella caseinilytica]|uniref:Bacteriocin-protection, YdeI or OmpD-Associated n=1 Tax=Evansella caseinilytica TaxID=1503961 RepID=A0A1H3SJY2_9BACI|nr:YdeI/OmpD-associated family protein [Evansella caseinilytica]SDZ38282.1 Bacteriocin-protection, YdeI or OmpD-Associated [Evansella caseinilytica]